MASFQQVNYCKNCKTNVSINETGQCKKCNSSQLNKTWSVRFRYVNEEHKEIQKRLSGFSTKKEANEEYLKFMATSKQFVKLNKQTHDLTFKELYNEYELFQKTRVKESTLYSFCSKSKLHICPYFNDFKVKDITPKDILIWQNRIDKYSYKYKTTLRQNLTAILKYAERYYNITSKINLVDNFRKPIKKKEMQVWTPAEFNDFIEKVSNEQYKVFFYALYLTGARRGELMATTWKDWNLQKSTLNIDKTFTSKNLGTKKGGISSSPKNEFSIREISIPQNLNDIIKDFKKTNFTEPNGKVFDIKETTLDRIKRNACQASGIKEIRIHDFRHSHASLLISEGISIVAVAKRLGHGNIEQTLNTYSHLMPNEDIKTIELLSKCLKI